MGVGLIGGVGLFVLSCIVANTTISAVPASGVAALIIGAAAAIISRLWRTPSVGIISGGIVPLVPGLALYTGLMQLIRYPPGDPLFPTAIGTLFTAVALALTIAAGASLGSMIGRPLRQQLASQRNTAAFAEFMRRQVKPTSANFLAGLALGRSGRRRHQAVRTDEDPSEAT